MKITFETELMKNQKHADVMAPDLAFEVLQTPEGDALFFSIGTDGVFYVTQEERTSRTGWNKIDLSTVLSASHNGLKVAAKVFALSQNAQTLAFDLVLVLNSAGGDFLYLSLNNSNNAKAWVNGVSWTLVPFDASGEKKERPLTIADVYLMNVHSLDGSAAVQNCFVDILRNPGAALVFLDRYYIQPSPDPSSSPRWVPHTLPADFAPGSISSCLGHRTDDYVPGIYTLGTIGSEDELIYSPQYNCFNPDVAPLATRLNLPEKATAISSALNSAGDTNLFVAATDGLYLFTPDHQNEVDKPALVVPSSSMKNNNIIAGASSLSASTVGSRTVVWGLNAQGDLFHVYCPVGSEATASAWSIPFPVYSGVERYAFYINIQAANSVLFAHLSGRELVCFKQDPMTTTWSQRGILLPHTRNSDMLEFNSFTSHIKISDDYGVGQPSTPVTLTSTSPVTVYINDVYHVLTPDVPVQTTADEIGTVTVIQETQSLSSAVCFQITVPGPPVVEAMIDPLSKAMHTLSAIQSGEDLGNVQIETVNGSMKRLIPSSVTEDDKKAVAESIINFLKIKDTLPSDGSIKTTPDAPAGAPLQLMAAVGIKSWGASFGRDGLRYEEGADTHQHLAIPVSTKAIAPKNIGDSIAIAAGDLFNFLKHAFDDVESFVVHEVDGFYYFLVKIGEKFYSAILNCVSAVVGAVEFIFNKIGVFFEHLVPWLGFIFAWDDINRTHKVMKNFLKQYVKRAMSSLDLLETSVNAAFSSLESNLKDLAGLTDPHTPVTIGAQQQASVNVPGSNSPQSHWALHHTKNGLSSAETSYRDPDRDSSKLDKILTDLEALVTQEIEGVKTTVMEVKEKVIDQFSSLTPFQVVERMLAIISGLVLESAKNVLVKVIDIIKILADGVLDLLDAPLDIPILSRIYNKITGDELTVLDLICLIGAIPATILYKIIGGETPYPDNSDTQALIDAPDFGTLTKLLTANTIVSSARAQALSKFQAAVSLPREEEPSTGRLILSAVFYVGACFGSFAVVFCAVQKNAVTRVGREPSCELRIFSICSYIMCASTNYPYIFQSSSWPAVLNDLVTVISLLKTFADNSLNVVGNSIYANTVSCIADHDINLAWAIAAIGSFSRKIDRKSSDGWALAANLTLDLAGILAPFTSEIIAGPEYAPIFFMTAQGLTLIHGGLCIPIAILTLGRD